MRRWLAPALIVVGLAYLTVWGDLNDSEAVDTVPVWVPWHLFFAVWLGVVVWHHVTRSRFAAAIELALILAAAIIRSIIYLANGAQGPLGVWLVVVGYALLSWRRTFSGGRLECDNATWCQLRRPPDRQRIE